MVAALSSAAQAPALVQNARASSNNAQQSATASTSKNPLSNSSTSSTDGFSTVSMSSYTVRLGDSLWNISQALNVSLTAIIQANHLTNASNLSVGQVLKIPQDQSITALQRNLARLGYLPLTDSFQWAYSNVPSSLQYLWQQGTLNIMTKGAVMEFQSANGLQSDGIPGPITWNAITRALIENFSNPYGYSFVYVSDTYPFTLYLWNDGHYILTSLVNLGIPESQTITGTYPIYLQYESQEMTGTNPDGSTYDDPGVPYVSYFYHGEAIHGFPRATYGSQMSLGCVELPYAQAAAAWPYLHIGTLVTIDN